MSDLEHSIKLQQLVMDLIIQAVDIRGKTTDPWVENEMQKMVDKLGEYLSK